MSEPHVIRLREPWEFEATEDARRRWWRRFGRPTGIEPGVIVSLVFRAGEDVSTLWLNDEAIGTSCAARQAHRVDVTARLRERNQIEFVAPAGTQFEVWLEIVAD